VTRLRPSGWLALSALLIPVVAAVVLWVWQSRQVDDLEAARAEDRAALDAATLETLNWASVDHRNIDEFVSKVKDGATGVFLDQFNQSETALRTLIRRNRSVQVPTIPKDGAALLERRGDEARVLIVMDADVTNASTRTPQPRQYRLQVTVTKEKGRWLTSNLEFVDATA
jgi:Mce-associated membrane protein